MSITAVLRRKENCISLTLTDIPKPLTTVGYNSDAANGSTTKADDIPILPMQYKTSITV